MPALANVITLAVARATSTSRPLQLTCNTQCSKQLCLAVNVDGIVQQKRRDKFKSEPTRRETSQGIIACVGPTVLHDNRMYGNIYGLHVCWAPSVKLGATPLMNVTAVPVCMYTCCTPLRACVLVHARTNIRWGWRVLPASPSFTSCLLLLLFAFLCYDLLFVAAVC